MSKYHSLTKNGQETRAVSESEIRRESTIRQQQLCFILSEAAILGVADGDEDVGVAGSDAKEGVLWQLSFS